MARELRRTAERLGELPRARHPLDAPLRSGASSTALAIVFGSVVEEWQTLEEPFFLANIRETAVDPFLATAVQKFVNLVHLDKLETAY